MIEHVPTPASVTVVAPPLVTSEHTDEGLAAKLTGPIAQIDFLAPYADKLAFGLALPHLVLCHPEPVAQRHLGVAQSFCAPGQDRDGNPGRWPCTIS